MTICGWCRGEGTYNGTTCVCRKGMRKPHFTPKKKSRFDNSLPNAHKHTFHFLSTTERTEWFMCNCGETKKVPI